MADTKTTDPRLKDAVQVKKEQTAAEKRRAKALKKVTQAAKPKK
jgi:hypothetical protein